jgi:hypothetical protein
MNGYLIYYYQQQPGEFNTIVWIYWLQSVLIGLFNFFDLMSVKNPDETSMSLNSQPVAEGSMGCAAWFFLFHYGFFHFVYAIFLLVGKHSGVNGKLLLITAGIFVTEEGKCRQDVFYTISAHRSNAPDDTGSGVSWYYGQHFISCLKNCC